MENHTNSVTYGNNGQIAEMPTAIGFASIRGATAEDDSWVRKLSKMYSNQIGFLPDAARRHRISLNHVKLIEINGLEAGFFIHSHGIRKVATLSQIALSQDAWRNGIGEFAVNTLLQMQSEARFPGLFGKIREGLPMNLVALKTHGNMVQTQITDAKRGLPLLHYTWKSA